MKQKVATKAIIKQDGKVLLLRRKGGRPSITGKYELPGGRVHMNQQPEDALEHALRIHVGVSPETIQLDDVMSFVDPDDRILQYVFLIYRVSLKPVDKTVSLSSEYDKYVWKKLSDIQRNEMTESTLQILGLQSVPFSPQLTVNSTKGSDDIIASLFSAVIYTDGGSRGNPGPSASGYVVMSSEGHVVYEGGAYLGRATNNIAEYEAVYLGLQKAQELGVRQVEFRLDSQLVANQMNGLYRVKNDDLQSVHDRIVELVQQFEKVSFTHVRREYNQLADGVVNKILDQQGE